MFLSLLCSGSDPELFVPNQDPALQVILYPAPDPTIHVIQHPHPNPSLKLDQTTNKTGTGLGSGKVMPAGS
jgi:hypothetical protein